MRNPWLPRILAVLIAAALVYRFSTRRSFEDPVEKTQYALIDDEIPNSIRNRLHPWIAGFIGLTTDEAKSRLEKRWANIDRPSLKILRESLLECDITSIVITDTGGMIKAIRSGTEGESIGDFWLLPARLDRLTIKEQLDNTGLSGNSTLNDFLYYFGGLAESNEASGHFVYFESPLPTFTDSWDGTIEGFDDWENSLMLYHARNGCFILVRDDGKVAWWLMQEHRVEEIAPDIETFLQDFGDYRKISWPFDPYGPPSTE